MVLYFGIRQGLFIVNFTDWGAWLDVAGEVGEIKSDSIAACIS